MDESKLSLRKFRDNDEILVRYRPLAELERWLAQRVDDRTPGKTMYVGIIAVLFAVCGIPLLIMVLNHMVYTLSYGLASGQIASQAGGAIGVLVNSLVLVLGLAAVGAVYYASLPTHLRLTKSGMQLLWRHKLYNSDGKLVAWDDISHIDLCLPKGKTSPLDHFVRFNSGSKRSLSLRLGGIPDAGERARILQAVEEWAPSLKRDAAVVQALELPPDHSYTELWLQALSGPPKRERLKPLETGAILKDGRYRVVKPLGVGGQGTAYLALDQLDENETVVLKEFILPVFVDVNIRRQSLERFEKEARILQQLDNEQIVRLNDFFVEDHRGYLVLEHIDGASLRDRVLVHGALPEAEAVQLAKQMCEIQKYLHSLTPPVVHRDFTPDNLILRKDGMLKLVDFNVAQQTESTATGTVVGKHAYLPPEQFRGRPTSQSDIYALGASLYFILCGRDPEPISTLHPKKNNAAVSDWLDQIVAKATAIEVKDRYASASELRADLSHSLSSSRRDQA